MHVMREHGGMHVMKGKFGNYFQLDLKDDDTEKFFKILGEQLQSLAGAYLNEKPWNLKSPIVEYDIFYSVHCKIPQNFNELKVAEYFQGYCEIRPYHAFSEKNKRNYFHFKQGPLQTASCGTSSSRDPASRSTSIISINLDKYYHS